MKNRYHGFTLIEILIAVVIIGILAGIAVPQYGQYVSKARRSDAHIALRSAAQEMERCRTQQFSYATCTLNSATSEEGHYDIVASGQTATAYLLTATAVTGGKQANDTGCTSLSLNALGTTTPTTGDCW